jgi:hypothetical protein
VLFLAEGDSLELCSDDQRINMVRYDAVLLDQGTTWTLQAGQGMIFIADIHYYDSEKTSTRGRRCMSERADVLFTNARLATLADGYGIVEDGAVAVRDGRIAWVGRAPGRRRRCREHDCGGLWLTPGLVDCHTHIVHAGNRSDEWEARLNGASYEDIARQGGGIMSTVRATRAAARTICCARPACRASAPCWPRA